MQGGGVLDELGRVQVKALALRLADEPVAVIYASPLTRTLQTARMVAGPHDLPVRRRGLLRDINYGVYSGMLFSEARKQDPDLWERWRTAPQTVRFSEGEGLADLRWRMERFLEEAGEWWGRTVVVVTHDSPIRAIASIASGVDDSRHNEMVVKVASITEVEITPDGLRLLAHGDTSHLAGINGE